MWLLDRRFSNPLYSHLNIQNWRISQIDQDFHWHFEKGEKYLKNITLLDESETQLLKDNVEEIDKIVGSLINRGFPEECKEWMLSNLKKLNGLNDAIGNVLDIW